MQVIGYQTSSDYYGGTSITLECRLTDKDDIQHLQEALQSGDEISIMRITNPAAIRALEAYHAKRNAEKEKEMLTAGYLASERDRLRIRRLRRSNGMFRYRTYDGYSYDDEIEAINEARRRNGEGPLNQEEERKDMSVIKPLASVVAEAETKLTLDDIENERNRIKEETEKNLHNSRLLKVSDTLKANETSIEVYQKSIERLEIINTQLNSVVTEDKLLDETAYTNAFVPESERE
jgi:hypothetical protein